MGATPTLRESTTKYADMVDSLMAEANGTKKKKAQKPPMAKEKKDMTPGDFDMDGNTTKTVKVKKYTPRYGSGQKKQKTAAQRRHDAMNK